MRREARSYARMRIRALPIGPASVKAEIYKKATRANFDSSRALIICSRMRRSSMEKQQQTTNG